MILNSNFVFAGNSWKNTLYFLLSPNYKKLVFAATSMLTFFGVTAAFYTV